MTALLELGELRRVVLLYMDGTRDLKREEEALPAAHEMVRAFKDTCARGFPLAQAAEQVVRRLLRHATS